MVHRAAIALLVAALTLTGCGGRSGAGDVTWPPRSHKNDQEASQIPADAKVGYNIPRSDPMTQQGTGGIDTYGNFVPREGFEITGGSLISTVGPVKRTAKFGSWAWVYKDAAKAKKHGWGPCLTSGEIIVAKSDLLSPAMQGLGDNRFEVEDLGDRYFIIRLDPAKGHRLCILRTPSGNVFTAGFQGTRVDCQGQVVQRRADGWYVGDEKLGTQAKSP